MDPVLILLLVCVIIFFLILILKKQYEQAQAKLTAQIIEIQTSFKTVTDPLLIINTFGAEAQVSINHADLAKKLEERVYSQSFPDLASINTTESGSSIFEKLGQSFNPDAPVFAGVEQIVLDVLPPDHLLSCVDFVAQSVGMEVAATVKDIAPIIKHGLVQGWQNLHNPGVLKECFSIFFTSLKDNFGPEQFPAFGSEVSVGSAITAMLPDRYQDLINGFTVLKDTISPAINLPQHGDQIKRVVLSHTQQLAKGTQAASTVARGVSAHIPYVTIIYSTVREIKLLSDKKTSFETSLKNVALDAVGAGGGAFAGLKAGALVGTAIGGPPGAAIGGLIGSILGGVGGRLATNAIKEMGLKEALSDYYDTHTSMMVSLHSMAINAYECTRDVVIKAKSQYKKSLNALPSPKQYTQESMGYIYTIKAGLTKDLQHSLSEIHTLKNSFLFSFSYEKEELLTLEDHLNQALYRLSELASPLDFCQELSSFPFPADGQCVALLPTVTQTLRERNAAFMPSMMAYSYDAAQLYQGAYNQIVQTFNEQALNYESEGKRWKYILNDKEAIVTAERNKLGK